MTGPSKPVRNALAGIAATWVIIAATWILLTTFAPNPETIHALIVIGLITAAGALIGWLLGEIKSTHPAPKGPPNQ